MSHPLESPTALQLPFDAVVSGTGASSRRILTVEEWRPISLGNAGDGLSYGDASELEAAAGVGASRLFIWGRTTVSVTNWIGTVRGTNVELHIVPKGWTDVSSASRVQVQENLAWLAAQALGSAAALTGRGTVSVDESIPEHIQRQFLETARLALRRKNIRVFQTLESRGIELRGALVFPGQILQRISNPGYFATRSTVLSWDNGYNRVLATAARLIADSAGEGLRAQALALLASLRCDPQPGRLKSERQAARRMQLSPLHVEALDLAELVLELRGAGLFAGGHDLDAHLMASDVLWERGVGAVLARQSVVPLVLQPRGNLALRSLKTGRGVLEMIPDVLGGAPTPLIADTKWKSLDVLKPKLDRGDLYQALSYAQHFGSSQVSLIYPALQPLASTALVAQLETVVPPKTTIQVWALPLAAPRAELLGAIRQILKPPSPQATSALDLGIEGDQWTQLE